MISLEDILPRLNGVRKSGSGYSAFCPAHDDRKNRSLALREHNGTLLMHCFCGCGFFDILKAINIELKAEEPQLEAIYDYTDAEGNVIYQVLRYWPKTFKQRKPDGTWNLQGVERQLFRLPEVIEAINGNNIIYFVEGEKDCINLGHWGLTATTCSGGANVPWQPQYSETLRDARVALIPDNDEAGRKHTEKIANYIYGWATIKMLNLGIDDMTEWLKTHNAEELQTLWDNTKEYIPIGAVTRDEFNQVKGHLIYLNAKLDAHTDKKTNKDYY